MAKTVSKLFVCNQCGGRLFVRRHYEGFQWWRIPDRAIEVNAYDMITTARPYDSMIGIDIVDIVCSRDDTHDTGWEIHSNGIVEQVVNDHGNP